MRTAYRNDAQALCPRCGAVRIVVRADVATEIEVARDPALGTLVVVAERIEDQGVDASAAARCTRCGWEGHVGDLGTGFG